MSNFTFDVSVFERMQRREKIAQKLMDGSPSSLIGKIGRNLPEHVRCDEELIDYLMELEETGNIDKLEKIVHISEIFSSIQSSYNEFAKIIKCGDLTPQNNRQIQVLYEILSENLDRIPVFGKTRAMPICPKKDKGGNLISIPFDYVQFEKLADLHMLAYNPKMFVADNHHLQERMIDHKRIATELVLVDTSYSMSSGRSLELAQLYLINRLNKALKGELEFQIITFNVTHKHVTFINNDGIETRTITNAINADVYKQWVWSLYPKGSTVLQSAIDFATKVLGKAEFETLPVITIFTDDGGQVNINNSIRNEINAILTMQNYDLQKEVVRRNGKCMLASDIFASIN